MSERACLSRDPRDVSVPLLSRSDTLRASISRARTRSESPRSRVVASRARESLRFSRTHRETMSSLTLSALVSSVAENQRMLAFVGARLIDSRLIDSRLISSRRAEREREPPGRVNFIIR